MFYRQPLKIIAHIHNIMQSCRRCNRAGCCTPAALAALVFEPSRTAMLQSPETVIGHIEPAYSIRRL